MSFTSLADYHRQRAASAASSLKRRAQKWFYDEAATTTSSGSSRNWSEWDEGDLLDSTAYDESGYSASTSLSRYWGGSYSSSSYEPDSKKARAEELTRALKSVARSCNAIRATVGKGKELSLKVKWSNGVEANNVKANDVIILSPDTIADKKIKENWAEGKRSDALVGDALTAAAQKRTITPSVVADAIAAENLDPDAVTARILWSAIETDVAQQALLNDYKGAAVYFAASNAFHSSDDYRTKVESAFGNEKVRKSEAATAALAWNILHQKKLELPDDVREATSTAMREFAKAKTCRDRWQASLRAVKFLRSLDPEQPQQPPSPPNPEPNSGGDGQGEGDSKPQPPQPNPNGDFSSAGGEIGIADLLGDDVTNTSKVYGDAESVEDLAEESGDTNAAHFELEELAKRTVFNDKQKLPTWLSPYVAPSTKALLAGYDGLVRRLSGLADLFSNVTTFESFGRRSGYLDNSKLWAVPSGESNVFIRRDDAGEKREVSIAVLVDLSGSTDCQSDKYGWAAPTEHRTHAERVNDLTYHSDRISVNLKRSATVLSEALRSSGDASAVQVRTYGHNVRNSRTQVYYYGNTSNVVIESEGGGTNEAGAVSRTVQHLLESDSRECRKILICVGDGETDTSDLKRAVDAANKLGVEVYAVIVAESGYTKLEHVKRHADVAFGKGRTVAVSDKDVKTLPAILHSFVTRVLSKAR